MEDRKMADYDYDQGEPELQRPRAARHDIEDLLTAKKTVAAMKSMATSHLSPERLIRLSLIAVRKTPKLKDCDPLTLLGAFIGCSALGLEPNTPLQHLHLIPYGSDVQVIIGYRGYFELGRRSGLITGAHADVVYPNDLFGHMYGTETYLRHQSRDWDGQPNEYTHAYCFVQLRDGQAFTVMTKSAVLRIRDRSQNYRYLAQKAKSSPRDRAKLDATPWVQDEHRQARKTAVRQLFSGGEVPLSLEMQNALSVDERKVDFKALADASREEIVENMGGFVRDDDDTARGEDVEDRQLEHRPEEELGEVRQDEERDPEPVAAEPQAAAPKMQPPRSRRDVAGVGVRREEMFR
jgi:recombination protein RecT